MGSHCDIVWSGHQVFAELKAIARDIRLLVLPEHSIDPQAHASLLEQKNVMLTHGVPHRVMRSTLQQAKEQYEKQWGALPNKPRGELLGIVLPGDAPDAQGQMRWFTPADARQLAARIVKNEGTNKHYLITNGPRTGGYNYKTRQKLAHNPHRHNRIDEVSQAFVTELNLLGIKHQTFFDFQFSHLPSVYQSLLSLATKGMRLYIPGESISMVSEATDVTHHIVVTIVSSMNFQHHTFVDTIKSSKTFAVLNSQGHIEYFQSKTKERFPITSAQAVAREISKLLAKL